MKQLVASLGVVAFGLGGLSGCANMTETHKTTGTGAALGAAMGAGDGYLWSKHMEEQS